MAITINYYSMKLNIGEFSGSVDELDRFICIAEGFYNELKSVEDKEYLANNIRKLIPGKLFNNIPRNISNFIEFKRKLISMFRTPRFKFQIQAELAENQQTNTESIDCYTARVKKCAAELEEAEIKLNNNQDLSVKMLDQLNADVLEAYIDGLLLEYRIEVYSKQCQSLEAAYEVAKQREQINEYRLTAQRKNSCLICSRCGKDGHETSSCPANISKEILSFLCSNCEQQWHPTINCSEEGNKDITEIVNTNQNNWKNVKTNSMAERPKNKNYSMVKERNNLVHVNYYDTLNDLPQESRIPNKINNQTSKPTIRHIVIRDKTARKENASVKKLNVRGNRYFDSLKGTEKSVKKMFLTREKAVKDPEDDPYRLKQCYKCQRIGHLAAMCKYAFRCVKCCSSHPQGLCGKKEDDLPSCVNCKTLGHPANYRSCPYIKDHGKGSINIKSAQLFGESKKSLFNKNLKNVIANLLE